MTPFIEWRSNGEAWERVLDGPFKCPEDDGKQRRRTDEYGCSILCHTCGSYGGHQARYVPRYVRRPEYDAPRPGSLEKTVPATIWFQTTFQGHEVVFDKDPYVDHSAKCYVDGHEREIEEVSRLRDGGTTRIEVKDLGRVTRPSPLKAARR